MKLLKLVAEIVGWVLVFTAIWLTMLNGWATYIARL